jgi:hypothetical protein
MQESYRGHCFCGEVEVEVTGDPFLMGFCHCTSCRTWLGAPVNGFSLWQPEAVKVVKGADKLGVFKKTERSHRSWSIHQFRRWALLICLPQGLSAIRRR